MNITRRDALLGATAAAAVTGAATIPLAMKAAGVKAALAGKADPLREGVQALVDEIRRDLDPDIAASTFWALQEAADRLETLPGIQPVPNEFWERWKPDIARFHRKDWRALRLAGGMQS